MNYEVHIPRQWFPKSFNFARMPHSPQFDAWREDYMRSRPVTIGGVNGAGNAPDSNGGFGLYVIAYGCRTSLFAPNVACGSGCICHKNEPVTVSQD